FKMIASRRDAVCGRDHDIFRRVDAGNFQVLLRVFTLILRRIASGGFFFGPRGGGNGKARPENSSPHWAPPFYVGGTPKYIRRSCWPLAISNLLGRSPRADVIQSTSKRVQTEYAALDASRPSRPLR